MRPTIYRSWFLFLLPNYINMYAYLCNSCKVYHADQGRAAVSMAGRVLPLRCFFFFTLGLFMFMQI